MRCLLLSCFALSLALPVAAKEYYLYVGTYTGPNSKGIYGFRYDPATLAVEPLGAVAEMPRPSFLAVSPDRRFLYAVSELGNDAKSEGFVHAFAIDAATGKLTALNKQASGGGGACHLVVDRTGKFLLVANYGTGSAASFPLNADGSIGERISQIQFAGSGPNARRQRGPHAHAAVLSPDNRFLIVPDLGTDLLHVLSFDRQTGVLKQSSDARAPAGAGPRHFTFSRNGRFAYLLCEMGSRVVPFRYDAKSGTLTPLGEPVSTLPADFSGENNSAEIETDSAGRFVYASNRGHDSIAVFSANPRTGALDRVQVASVEGKTPRNFAIDPTGNYLFVANQDSNQIVVLKRDPKTGKLATAGKTIDAPTPVCLLFLPTR